MDRKFTRIKPARWGRIQRITERELQAWRGRGRQPSGDYLCCSVSIGGSTGFSEFSICRALYAIRVFSASPPISTQTAVRSLPSSVNVAASARTAYTPIAIQNLMYIYKGRRV